jgi:hypothetical protein
MEGGGLGVGRVMPLPNFLQKYIKMYIETSYFDVPSEVQKDSEDVSVNCR